MKTPTTLGVLLVLAILLGGAALRRAAPGPALASASAPLVVHVTVAHSRFLVATGDDDAAVPVPSSKLVVPAGATVRFVVRNQDPIDHELIVGPMEVQDRHERGSEAHHDGSDGAVSVPSGEARETSWTFPDAAAQTDGAAGQVWIGCHLPGHWRFGMRLPVDVVPGAALRAVE